MQLSRAEVVGLIDLALRQDARVPIRREYLNDGALTALVAGIKFPSKTGADSPDLLPEVGAA
jgi:hypothetical protein